MSERLPSIWMNVTTSANWQRPPLGIVRVERCLRDELAKLYGSRFNQCVWQGERFVAWVPQLHVPDSVETNRQEDEPSQPTIKPALPPIFPILPSKQALRALGQGLLSLMPGRLHHYFNRLLYRIRPYVGRILAIERSRRFEAKTLWRATARTGMALGLIPKVSGSPDPGELFSRGDVFISVGLDWDSPYYKQFYELRRRTGVKVVTCCYDLIPVLFPQYCVYDVASLFTSYFLELADSSDLILCISKQSEKDLNEMLHRTGGARPPTHVFPLGDNVPLAVTEELSTAVKSICQQPFILFVSSIERRKNHEVLYRAYHLLCKDGKRSQLPKLVFVGMPGWGVGELLNDIEIDPLTRGMIVQLNHVNDGELLRLYESSLFCVFPSLYEGWGLPVGEALSLGKAVLCSDRGSLPEVGGDLVRYVDPWNAQAWADEMYRMATDDAWRAKWEQQTRFGYSINTWENAGASVASAINSILQSAVGKIA